MNVFTFLLIIFAAIIAGVAYLWYLAATGSGIAMGILIGSGIMMIFVTFQLIDVLKDWLRDRAETRRFQDNMRENLRIAAASQNLQNQQLIGAQRSQRLLGTGQRMPNLDGDVIEIDEYTYE